MPDAKLTNLKGVKSAKPDSLPDTTKGTMMQGVPKRTAMSAKPNGTRSPVVKVK